MMRTLRTLGVLLAALIGVAGLSGCGEKKVTSYEPGQYSGGRLVSPWDSPQYAGKQAQWESAIQARAQGQNDYVRIPAR
jgi:hypothetical protein